jgi:hypothetical protein
MGRYDYRRRWDDDDHDDSGSSRFGQVIAAALFIALIAGLVALVEWLRSLNFT